MTLQEGLEKIIEAETLKQCSKILDGSHASISQLASKIIDSLELDRKEILNLCQGFTHYLGIKKENDEWLEIVKLAHALCKAKDRIIKVKE